MNSGCQSEDFQLPHPRQYLFVSGHANAENLLYPMSCILTIAGKNLDVDTFIFKSKLKPYKISYKGQPKFKTKPDSEKLSRSLLSIALLIEIQQKSSRKTFSMS